MNKPALFLLFVLLLGCNAFELPKPEPPAYSEGMSLLGDYLVPDTTNLQVRNELLTEINEVFARNRDSLEIDDYIWSGRRVAYEGAYQSAIDIYTEGITVYPNVPHFYRHRAHRYITLRKLDDAIVDLVNASVLIDGTEDEIEPDGLPNAQNKPRSTLHTNIYYHLGLAFYLKGDYENSALEYKKCLDASTNDDMLVASLYWYYMSLRRMGKDQEAGAALNMVKEEMDIIENFKYHDLLLVFKGIFQEEDVLGEDIDISKDATLGYGLANWHYINGRTEKAMETWRAIYDQGINSGGWAAFGFIASEAELQDRQ